jgi:hypothetical protein
MTNHILTLGAARKLPHAGRAPPAAGSRRSAATSRLLESVGTAVVEMTVKTFVGRIFAPGTAAPRASAGKLPPLPEWEREVGERGARIKCEAPANLYEREQWPAMIEFMIDAMIRLDRATRRRISDAGRRVRPASSSTTSILGEGA